MNLSLFFVLALSVKVTLVHSGKRLLEFLGTKVSDKTLKWLQSKKNVEVILNDRYKAHISLQMHGLSIVDLHEAVAYLAAFTI